MDPTSSPSASICTVDMRTNSLQYVTRLTFRRPRAQTGTPQAHRAIALVQLVARSRRSRGSARARLPMLLHG